MKKETAGTVSFLPSAIKIITNLYKNKKTIILNVFYLSFNKENDTDMILYNLSRYKNGDSI